MNETIKTILNRRSIRTFLPEQIKESELKEIIGAGLYAPSAMNLQPWHFTVVQNSELIERLNEDIKKSLQGSGNKYLEAIVKRDGYHIFHHAPAATENMLLAAESLGIGTCWIGLAAFLFGSEDSQKYMKEMKIPEGFKPLYAIALGYKKDNVAKPPQRREGTVSYIK